MRAAARGDAEVASRRDHEERAIAERFAVGELLAESRRGQEEERGLGGIAAVAEIAAPLVRQLDEDVADGACREQPAAFLDVVAGQPQVATLDRVGPGIEIVE